MQRDECSLLTASQRSQTNRAAEEKTMGEMIETLRRKKDDRHYKDVSPRRIAHCRRAVYVALALLIAAAFPPESSVAQERRSTSDSLTGKHVVGYQGWFTCDRDQRDRRWTRWFNGRNPESHNMTFDLWPDMGELDPDERCPTGLTLGSGQPATVFSSLNSRTVGRHFRWMREYDIDGAALQRFLLGLVNRESLERRDRVLANVRAASRATGRAYFILYDISGAPAENWAEILLDDWKRLSMSEQITAEPNYMHHGGKPVLAIWGLGFNDRPANPQRTGKLIAALRNLDGPASPFIIGGVPAFWRELRNDQQKDPGWREVHEALDGLMPWTVGRYHDEGTARAFAQNTQVADIRWAKARGKFYLPVVFPGFSQANGRNDLSRFNKIPRRCGRFYWSQVSNLMGIGARALYTAMFDEVDEGTAIFPTASSADAAPRGARTVTLDIDGCALPSTWYLKLAQQASRALEMHRAPRFESIGSPPK
jgi:hypothetical protein